MSALTVALGLIVLGGLCVVVSILAEPKYRFEGEERKP